MKIYSIRQFRLAKEVLSEAAQHFLERPDATFTGAEVARFLLSLRMNSDR